MISVADPDPGGGWVGVCVWGGAEGSLIPPFEAELFHFMGTFKKNGVKSAHLNLYTRNPGSAPGFGYNVVLQKLLILELEI